MSTTANLIVKLGQSNSSGPGRTVHLDPDLTAGPMIRARLYSRLQDATIPLEAGKSMAFDGMNVDPSAANIEEGAAFGTEMRIGRLAEKFFWPDEVFLLKCGRGGTVLVDGVATEDWNADSVASYLDEMKTAIGLAKTRILAEYPKFTDVQVLFFELIHGESDGAVIAWADVYGANLIAAINEVRAEVPEAATSPWILVKPSRDLLNAAPVDIEAVDTIRTAMDTTAAGLTGVVTVDADGLPLYTKDAEGPGPYTDPDVDPWNNWPAKPGPITGLHYRGSSIDTIARRVWGAWVDNFSVPFRTTPSRLGDLDAYGMDDPNELYLKT